MVYDRDRKTVKLEDPAREVDLYMEVLGPHGISWAAFYRLFATLALMTLLAVELEFWVLAAMDERLVISAFLGTLAVSTSYQLWRRKWIILHAIVD